ncbi:MAG TPA: proton-conducting transporter membrane subunit [Gemmatimonadales bacterium]
MLVLAAVTGAAGRSRRTLAPVVVTLTVMGCVATALAAALVLGTGHGGTLRLASGWPVGPWLVELDALSAWFTIVIGLIGTAAALWGFASLTSDVSRAVSGAHGLLAALIGTCILVVTAQAVIPFLMAWEAMTLTSYLLVVYHDDDAEIRRAGRRYLVATHAGALALILMFGLWSAGGSSLEFDALASRSAAPGPPRTAILLFALAGFGIKAGFVPLHFWLPPAHAGAPSHVSALLSGVMIKMGIYGLLRVGMMVGELPAWWGWTLVLAGVTSAILGVLWALAQHDIKRLLAYHSVENIGIILLGMGVGALGSTAGIPMLALLGYGGALLHVLNHALFKSLLFLAAGTVVHATGTRAIDRLGGLARALPRTWFAFAVGSAAIVGLPPLNGFLSEWLIFRGMFATGPMGGSLPLLLWGIPALALVGALALACFTKVCGVTFLGTPRTATRYLHGESIGLTAPPLALAALCLVVGLTPVWVFPPVLNVAALVAHLPSSAAHTASAVLRPAAAGLTVVGLALVGGLLVIGWLRHRQVARRGATIATTWGCGYATATPRMQYTAASFAAPLLDTVSILAPLDMTRTDTTLATHPVDPVLDRVLVPAWRILVRAAQRLVPFDHARTQMLLLLVVGALLVLLLMLATGWGLG